MSSFELAPLLKQRFFDSNGVPLAGGLLYSYQAGTTTPFATYTDSSGSTPNANPTVLDANGQASVWIGGGVYKFVLTDSLGNVQWTVDQVVMPGSSPTAISLVNQVTGILPIANGGTNASTQQGAINDLTGTQTAGEYLRSDGTNAKLSAIQVADVPVLNQNTTGTASNITATSNSTLTTLTALSLPGVQVSGNISGDSANVTGTVAIANGGTGQITAASAITALLPAQSSTTNGQVLESNGTSAAWTAPAATGVTSVATGAGLTGGTITSTGTISLATIANNDVLANTSGGVAAPVATGVSSLIDSAIGNVEGDILYRGATAWSVLAAGVSGQFLKTLGTSLTPEWATVVASGEKNYLSTYLNNPGNGDFETGTTAGWSLAHSALSGTNPTSLATAGTAFSATSGGTAAAAALTFSLVSTGQLAGSYCANLASSAASTAGDLLISNAFTIDKEDQAKALGFRLSYEVVTNGGLNLSGTSANSFALWIYDVANGWIQPAGSWGMTQGTGVGEWSGTFQTSANGTEFQLAIINLAASTGAYSVYVDDFFVGPQITNIGPVVTDWQSYVPTTAGFGTVAGMAAQWKRVGDSMQVMMTFSAGSAANGVTSVSLPPGYTIDASKIPNNTYIIVGSVAQNGQASTVVPIAQGGQSAINFGYFSSGATALSPEGTGVSSAAMSVFATVPITGWSSNVQMSSDSSQRVIAASYGLTTATAFGANAVIIYDTLISDTSASYSKTSGLTTIPVSGIYVLSSLADESGANLSVYVKVNGVSKGYLYTAASGYVASGSITLPLHAGDTVGLYTDTAATFNAAATNGFVNSFYIFRLSGNQVLAASDTVAASYTTTAGNTVNNTSPIVVFGTKDFDTTSSYNSTTGYFTAPISGEYRISAYAEVASTTTFSAGQAILIIANQGGSATTQKRLGQYRVTAAYTGTVGAGGSQTFRLLAGDTLAVTFYSDAATTLDTTAGANWLSIEKVGNN